MGPHIGWACATRLNPLIGFGGTFIGIGGTELFDDIQTEDEGDLY